MRKLSSLIFGKPDIPVEVGSTIPREIRIGSPVTAPSRTPFGATATDTRAAHRFVPRKSLTFLTLAGGKKLDARIINMSSKAVAVEADFSTVLPDAVMMVGSHSVKPGRKIKLGAVFVLVRPIDANLCTEDFLI